MARPKVKDKDTLKVKSLRVRVTESDLTEMRKMAIQKKLSVSELVRVCVLGDVKR